MRTIIFIDANSLIHRCFHALPPFTTSDNRPTGALYGLSSILLKIFREQRPDFIVAFFDRPEPTFRKEIFGEYKIHRPKAPDELVSQIIEAHQLFNQFAIKTFEIPGFEGDDLIGTAVETLKSESDLKIIILTGDLDILQLVENDKVVVEAPKRGVSEIMIYNEEAVKERYGVLPNQLSDYKGLVGDPSDNIPGVSGIGPKTASSLIQKYKDLENLLKNGQKEKSYKKISEFQEVAHLSKRLAQIQKNAPLALPGLEELKYRGLPKENLIIYFKTLGFNSLINRINNN